MAGIILVLGAVSIMADEAPGRPEYRFIATSDSFRLEKEMNAAAKEGFRLQFVSDTFAESQIGVLQQGYVYRGASGIVAIMETDRQAPARSAQDYKVLGATRVKTARRELDEAVSAGYEVIDLASLGEYIIILRRATGAIRP